MTEHEKANLQEIYDALCWWNGGDKPTENQYIRHIYSDTDFSLDTEALLEDIFYILKERLI